MGFNSALKELKLFFGWLDFSHILHTSHNNVITNKLNKAPPGCQSYHNMGSTFLIPLQNWW
jgi:hypothetical protein